MEIDSLIDPPPEEYKKMGFKAANGMLKLR